jgi:hypothetical protein
MSYIVRIKTHAFSTRPYSWEIYRKGEGGFPKGVPLAKSRGFFCSQKAARSAGNAALFKFVENREEIGGMTRQLGELVPARTAP